MDRQPGKRVDWNAPGHAHELTLSCFKRQQVLVADPVRRTLLQVLDEVRREFDFEVWAYVIMPACPVTPGRGARAPSHLAKAEGLLDRSDPLHVQAEVRLSHRQMAS